MKNRMQSFVDRGNNLIAKGKVNEAMLLITHGLEYYTGRIIKAVSPVSYTHLTLPTILLV